MNTCCTPLPQPAAYVVGDHGAEGRTRAIPKSLLESGSSSFWAAAGGAAWAFLDIVQQTGWTTDSLSSAVLFAILSKMRDGDGRRLSGAKGEGLHVLQMQ